jgi:periplasmic protein TonB
MSAIICLILLVLIVTLYDYVSSKSWEQVSSTQRNDLVFENRNKSYGAYSLRNEYDKRMMIITFSLLLLISLLFGAWRIYKSIPVVVPPAPPVDTTQMTIPAPPIDDVPPPPPEDIPPPVEETVAFMPPIVVDIPVDDEIPTQDDVKETKVDVKTQEGSGDEFAPPTDDGPPIDDTEPEPETFVDEEAEFPGGYPAMMAWIQKNLAFPETAIENNVQGKCFLRFVVSVNGNISSVTVTKGVPDCPECDKAAVKAIKAMPNWKAGKLNGRSVSSYCSIPINFAIE